MVASRGDASKKHDSLCVLEHETAATAVACVLQARTKAQDRYHDTCLDVAPFADRSSLASTVLLLAGSGEQFSGGEMTNGDARRGGMLIESYGCGACHAIPASMGCTAASVRRSTGSRGLSIWQACCRTPLQTWRAGSGRRRRSNRKPRCLISTSRPRRPWTSLLTFIA